MTIHSIVANDTTVGATIGSFDAVDTPVVSVCFTTAVCRAEYEVTGGNPWYTPAAILVALKDELLAVGVVMDRPGSEVRWNNAPERTLEEVAALLRRAAARAEHRG